MDTKIQDFIQSNKFPEERFLPVKKFESRFYISDHGRILSIEGRYKGIRIQSPHLDSLGYYAVLLRMMPIQRKCRVHQLVGEHFCEMIITDIKKCWNHKDGNKLNNYYLNLEYITFADNFRHAVATGLHDIKGEKHPLSKLTEKDVIEMRELRKEGLTFNEIANKFGVCRRQASDVIRGINWGWLK